MRLNRIVSSEVWHAERERLLSREKALTQAQDELAADRRRASWMIVDRNYRFRNASGDTGLVDLFDGRRQLIVYHHMLKPADPSPCPGCCMVGDQIPHLAHLRARDTSVVFVSCAPSSDIEDFRRRMGWQVPWFETTPAFNSAFDVTTGFGVNVFIIDDGTIYRTYFTSGRGVETLGTVWTLLDITPLGRQEAWEDSPGGPTQTPPYAWWRLHDEYDNQTQQV